MLSGSLQGIGFSLRDELHSELRLRTLTTHRGSDRPSTGDVNPVPIHPHVNVNGTIRHNTAPIGISVQFTQTGVVLGSF